MTIYPITHSQRGEEGAGVLSVHRTLDGAKQAILDWASDQWDAEDLPERLAEYLSADGEELITEEDWLAISPQDLED